MPMCSPSVAAWKDLQLATVMWKIGPDRRSTWNLRSLSNLPVYPADRIKHLVNTVNAATLLETEKQIESCEHCNADGAEIPFDNILDRVTGSDPSVTDYI